MRAQLRTSPGDAAVRAAQKQLGWTAPQVGLRPRSIRSGVIWHQGRRRWLCALISIESQFFACPTQSPAARNAFASEARGFTFGCA